MLRRFSEIEKLPAYFSERTRNLSDHGRACQSAHLKRRLKTAGSAFHRQRVQAQAVRCAVEGRGTGIEPSQETQGYPLYAQIRKGFSPDLSTALGALSTERSSDY